MAWSLVQQSPQASQGSGLQITPTLPAASTGTTNHPHLLVIHLISNANLINNPFTLPAGWAPVPNSQIDFGSAHNRNEWWYLVDTVGGVTSVVCAHGGSNSVIKGAIFEFDPGPNLTIITPNAAGTGSAIGTASVTVTTGSAAQVGDLVLAGGHQAATAALPIPVPNVVGSSASSQRTRQYSPITGNPNNSGGRQPITSVHHVQSVMSDQALIQVNNPPGDNSWINPAGFTFLLSDQALATANTRHEYVAYRIENSNSAETVTFANKLVSTSSAPWTGSVVTFTASSVTAPVFVGAKIDTKEFDPSNLTMQQAVTDWISYTGRALTVRRQDFTTIPGSVGTSLQADISAGRKVCMTFSPAFNPPTQTDLNALNTFLSSCKNSGLTADVALYPVPQSISGMTQANFKAAVQFYAATIRQYFPLVFVTSARDVQFNNGANWYPGDAYVDKVAATLYGNEYYYSATRLAATAAIADNASPPKPFGLWGFNFSTKVGNLVGGTIWPGVYPNTNTQAQAIAAFDGPPLNQPWAALAEKKYYSTEGNLPSASNDSQDIKGLTNLGVQAYICFQPIRDTTDAYAGSTYTDQYNKIVAACNYYKSFNANISGICLWNECNLKNKFASAASYHAHVNFYGSAVANSGLPLSLNTATTAMQSSVDYFPIANANLFSSIIPDWYAAEWVNNNGNKSPFVRPSTNTLSIAETCEKYNLVLGIGEWGVGAVPSTAPTTAEFTNFVDTYWTPQWQNWQNTHPDLMGPLIWFMGSTTGPNGITGSTPPAQITSMQNQFTALNRPALAQGKANGFFGNIQNFFTNRITAGKQCADIIIDNGSEFNTGPPINTGDYRIVLYDTMFDALNGGSGGTGNATLAGELDLTLDSAGSINVSQGATGQELDLTMTSSATLTGGQVITLPHPGPVAFPSYVPPVYSYFTTDLITNAPLGEIPVSSVSLDCQLNSAGNMSAQGNLDNPLIDNDDFITRTTPGRTAFWAYRDDTIVWGGIIWSRTWQSKGKTFSISGQTFESYAARRTTRSTFGTQTFDYNDGQCAIINDLWGQMQSVQYGNIGVLTSSLPTSDVLRTLTVNGWDLSVTIDDLIQSILVFHDGPDYTIQWNQDSNGLPVKQLVVAPRIGNSVGTTNLIVDYPGNLVDYTYDENASGGANQWWAVGDGTGLATTVGEATDQASLNAGWPLIEGVNSYSGVTEQSTIDSHASSDLSALPMPLVTHSADIFGAAQPNFGTYDMGDYAKVYVTDPRFESGTMFSVRVIGWAITPSDNQSGVESIALVFDEPTGGGG